MNTWTCDLIEALQAIEEKFGCPICIADVRLDFYAGNFYDIELTSGAVYRYRHADKSLKMLDK